ncbi:hypothetical protein ACE6H2_017955 [Prunus campanulata]
MFEIFEELTGTPFVFPEDISRHEFYKRLGKGSREDVVVVVAYELSKLEEAKRKKTAEQSKPREGRAKEKEKMVEQIKEQAKEAQTLMEKEEVEKKDKEAQTHTNRRNKS